jgi:prepilin peptidase CpaA
MMQASQAVVWFVSAILVEAAVIDGLKLRVPNWLTYHFALGGLACAAWTGGWAGVGWSLAGLATGLVLLLPLYAIGGMGAGDVKLLAGVGAWMGWHVTLGAFVASAMVGAVLALLLIARSGQYARHWALFRTIGSEILTVRDPVKLAETAAARKPAMLLLPYGIPIAMGSIGYFVWVGILKAPWLS